MADEEEKKPRRIKRAPKQTVGLRLPPDAIDLLYSEAERTDNTLSAVVTELIRKNLKK